MFGVTVLQDEHPVVAFEIVEDDDDVSFISVHVNGKGFEVFKHVGGAVGTIEEIGVFGLVIFQAEQNGGLIALSVGDGFEVAVHLKRWISFYVDSSIGVTGIGFDERSSAHLVARHAFQFGIVFLFRDTFNVTLVRVQFDFLFADVAFSPSTHMLGSATVASMTCFFVQFVDVATVRTLFERVTDGFDVLTLSLQVVVVASVSKEFAMTEGAGFVRFGKLATRQRSFGFQVIGTVISFAGEAPFAFA